MFSGDVTVAEIQEQGVEKLLWKIQRSESELKHIPLNVI